jgi:hypothetical protein
MSRSWSSTFLRVRLANLLTFKGDDIWHGNNCWVNLWYPLLLGLKLCAPRETLPSALPSIRWRVRQPHPVCALRWNFPGACPICDIGYVSNPVFIRACSLQTSQCIGFENLIAWLYTLLTQDDFSCAPSGITPSLR